MNLSRKFVQVAHVLLGVILITECKRYRPSRKVGNSGNEVGSRPSSDHRLIHVGLSDRAKWASRSEIEELLKQKKSYLDVTDLPSLPAKVGQIGNIPIPSTPRFEDAVYRRISAVNKERLKQFLTDLSSYSSRLAMNAMGRDVEEWLNTVIIKPLIESYSTISVETTTLEQGSPQIPFYKQRNVIVRMQGSDSILKEQLVIISAHMDSISVDGKPCLTPECLTKSAPGADDNGSGVSVLVEALRALIQTGFTPKRTVEFHFYAGGEFGLRGSLVTASNYKGMGKKVVGLLCFDMVGRGPGPIAVQSENTHPQLTQFVKALIDNYLETSWKDMDKRANFLSDYEAWTSFAYPAAYVSEGTPTPHMHSERDTIDTVDINYISEFAKLAVAFLTEFGEPSNEMEGDVDYDDGGEEGWIPLRPKSGLDGVEAEDEDESRTEKRLVLVDIDTPPKWMSQKELNNLIFKLKQMNFLDITDMPMLRNRLSGEFKSGSAAESASKIPTQIRYRDQVTKLIQTIRKERLEMTLFEGTSFYRNRYDGIAGQDYADHLFQNVLNQKLRNYTGKYYARKIPIRYAHWLAKQPNLVVHFEGNQLPEEIIIIGAHIDSVTKRIDELGTKCITPKCLAELGPGADDNLSGVAVVLEALTIIIESGLQPSRSVEFHFYGLEEKGLIGSARLASQYAAEKKNVVGMLNFDVVGYAPTPDLFKIGMVKHGTNPQMNAFVELLLNTYVDIPHVFNSTCGNCFSDWASWTRAGYPSAFPVELRLTPFIHTENDTVSTVNFDYVIQFAKLAVAWLIEFGEFSAPPPPRPCTGIEFYEGGNPTSNETDYMEMHVFFPIPQKRRGNHRRYRKSTPAKRMVLTELTGEAKAMSEDELLELRKTRNYIDITADPSARVGPGSANRPPPPVPESLQYETIVRNYIRKQKTGVLGSFKCVDDMTKAFKNRYWQNPNGRELSQWVINRINTTITNSGYKASGRCMSIFEREDEWSQRTVIFRVVGLNKTLQNQVVIFGAHLDTWNKRCFGNDNSFDPNCVSPGFDDNGVGACLLLTMVHALLHATFLPQRTMEFHWYSASEAGLRGAYSVASAYRRRNVNVIGMLNFDSVGYTGMNRTEKRIGIQTLGTDPILTQFLRNLTEKYVEDYPWENSNIGESRATDYMAWSLTGFPTAYLHEVADNPNIYTGNDTFRKTSSFFAEWYFRLGMAFAIEYVLPYHIRYRVPPEVLQRVASEVLPTIEPEPPAVEHYVYEDS